MAYGQRCEAFFRSVSLHLPSKQRSLLVVIAQDIAPRPLDLRDETSFLDFIKRIPNLPIKRVKLLNVPLGLAAFIPKGKGRLLGTDRLDLAKVVVTINL